MHKTIEVQLAKLEDIDIILRTLLELRPHLNPERVREDFKVQLQEGYQLVYVGDETSAYALLGFRAIHFFYSGKTLYIDDLITSDVYRNKGYAGMLMDWVKQYAKDHNFDHLSLDSGFQRKNAHRLYLNKGLELESFHFGRKVKDL